MVAGNAAVPDSRFVLAFYGIEDSPRTAEGFFKSVVGWIAELGYTPDKLSVGRTGSRGGVRGYRRALAKLERLGFADVRHFDLHSSLPNAHISATEYYASASLARRDDGSGYAVVAVPAPADKACWVSVAANVIRCTRPGYGIGFTLPLRQGPIFYALGANFSRISDFKAATADDDEERRSISRWLDLGMRRRVYLEGLLRYVYRYNFLTKPQLERRVDGTSLANWIEADPTRGSLELISDGVWLWEVAETELPKIRGRLHEQNAIFDWRRYCNVEPHIRTRLA